MNVMRWLRESIIDTHVDMSNVIGLVLHDQVGCFMR